MKNSGLGHPHIDARSLEMARIIVKRIDEDPNLMKVAHQYLGERGASLRGTLPSKQGVEGDPDPAMGAGARTPPGRIRRGSAPSKLEAVRWDRDRGGTPQDHRALPAAVAIGLLRPSHRAGRGDGADPQGRAVNRQQLEHVIRAVAHLTGKDRLIVIGSQAILGQFPNAPEELLISREADIYAPERPDLDALITGSLGEGSHFERTYQYFVDGVSPTTATLPAGWEDRLVPIRNENNARSNRMVPRGARHRDREVRREPREGPPVHPRVVETPAHRPDDLREAPRSHRHQRGEAPPHPSCGARRPVRRGHEKANPDCRHEGRPARPRTARSSSADRNRSRDRDTSTRTRPGLLSPTGPAKATKTSSKDAMIAPEGIIMMSVLGVGIGLAVLLERINARLDRRTFQTEAAADRRTMQQSMDAFRTEMQRLAERQSRLEGVRGA